MTPNTSRKDYMREYMRNVRAKNPPSEKGKMRQAIADVLTMLEGNDKPLAVKIRQRLTL